MTIRVGVCDDQALEVQFIAQQSGQNVVGKGGGRVGIGFQRGDGEMAGHDAANSRGNRGAEGNQFQVLEAIFVGANHRQIDVRVGRCVSVSREMLRRGEAAVFFHATHESGDEFCNALVIFAKRASIDDGIAGIIVHIGNRRVNPVNADGAGFESGDFPHGVGVGGISAGGQRHRSREGSAFIEAHGGAAFG